jgi:hypothetical protein
MNSKCGDPNCGCHVRRFWIELDDAGNPTGEVCWAYFEGDKPLKGNWLKVEESYD